MKRKTRKEMILDIYDREAMGEVTAREIALIIEALVGEFGPGGSMTPAEIARVLVDEDLPVRFDQIFRMISPADNYASIFKDLDSNNTLSGAETSLRKIDEEYRKFLEAKDQTGARYARQIALLAKRNSLTAAQSQSLTQRARDVHKEIAEWFTIWLQTPDIFEQWLELRKGTEDFKKIIEG